MRRQSRPRPRQKHKRGRPACRAAAMDQDPGAGSTLSRVPARALPPDAEAQTPAGTDEELYDCVDYYYLRDFPACGAGRSKGRTRRERELRTNQQVPGGHERHIMQKQLNAQRKRRQRQLQPGPRSRLP
ncbi:PREDICTED: nuclear transcriptional regulator 1-like protein [Elephantulus edwardii]|uniref:nuclear transcriptional regulator 1-like protein n=1 Tax=Elephantulus edwardii TaxID=28737 RepID=UPI0003F0A03C|nr:PREDICTED: nuclear transcriptional regulator 1-like protein [Elephantulus edwardii]